MFSTASIRDDMRYTANEPFNSFFANARDRLACKFAITPCWSSELRFSNGQKFRAGGTFPDVKKNTRPLSDTSRVLGFWLLCASFFDHRCFFHPGCTHFLDSSGEAPNPNIFFFASGNLSRPQNFCPFWNRSSGLRDGVITTLQALKWVAMCLHEPLNSRNGQSASNRTVKRLHRA